jgi:AraC family transcriptional regulator
MQPTILERLPETVLYTREVGDYSKTPSIALKKLFGLLNGKGVFQGIYGMGLDNPYTTKSEECRFDAFAKINLHEQIEIDSCIQKKEIAGGRFAVFVHQGPYSELSLVCNKIFQEWFPLSGYTPSTDPLFCEYLDYSDESNDAKTTKIFIPIKA